MKFIGWFVLFLLVLLMPLFIWLWQDQHAQPLDIIILNKTVPEGDLREHKGLTWLFNHLNIKKIDGDSYHVKEDYVGVAYENNKAVVRQLADDVSSADLIYVADTYGIYESQQEKRNDKIEGGLSAREWASIKHAVDKNDVPIIMEFNSISSPTESFVRQEVSHYLGFEQLGWTGRYFKDLSNKNGEIPQWLINSYESVDNRKWSFIGDGLVFVEEKSEMVQVLSVENGDIDQATVKLTFTQTGQEKFNLKDSRPYRYWFDVTEALEEDNVLAYFDLTVNNQGQALLEEWGIPTRFPAVIEKKQELVNSYYLAGDFVDASETPLLYQYSGYTKVKEWFTIDSIFPEQSFFWKTYVPMMKVLLADIKRVDKESELNTTYKPSVLQNDDGLTYSAKVNGDRFEVYQNGAWVPLTVKGVNIGMGKPGVFPGEAAITKGEYERWFKQIGEMNANSIRIYTLHPPAFYEALKEYNESHEKPLYVFHGVWIDEEPLEETLDAFTPDITKRFQQEFMKITDVVHGNAQIKAEPGHASGTYKADISPYVIGWIIGIEWYPFMVDEMATKYPDLAQYKGEYINTNKAVGFELWIAEQMDVLTTYEAKTYKWARPMSFTNWVTTDNIDQPAEPDEQENLATVDPNLMEYKQGLSMPGLFASYHVYPYYPDFLNLEERYTEYIDHRGEKNNYAGYLRDLKASNQMPVLIAEFGLPASRGLTHENPFGLNQGFHTEQEQGELLSRLYEDIIEEDMMGGLIFTWQDEWFKRTWNTLDLDDSDRRPFWSNAQTNEQHFGLLNFDRLLIHTDGQVDDWKGLDPVYQSEKGPVSALYTTHDERYLYMRIDGDSSTNWLAQNKPQLLFDITPTSGNERVNELEEIVFNKPFADFWLSIQSTEEARIKVDAYYDAFLNLYGINLKMIKPIVTTPQINSGVFNEIRFALSKEATRPDTGEVLPFSSYETGEMRHGNSNPISPDYDSLADYYFDEATGVLEIRIPWLLLNVKDPSSKQVFSDLYVDGIEGQQTINDIGIALVMTDERGKVTQSFPVNEANNIRAEDVYRYNWEAWERPPSRERLKQSYPIIQETFKNTP